MEFKRRSEKLEISENKLREEFLSDIPMHRLAEPEEIAETVAFLASREASYITGCAYSVCGGKVFI